MQFLDFGRRCHVEEAVGGGHLPCAWSVYLTRTSDQRVWHSPADDADQGIRKSRRINPGSQFESRLRHNSLDTLKGRNKNKTFVAPFSVFLGEPVN